MWEEAAHWLYCSAARPFNRLRDWFFRPQSAYILTWSGTKFYFLDPDPEMIHIHDIAHALSNLCRWVGHTKAFYSVAEHSVHVSELLRARYPNEPTLWLQGLLHDAAEAYIGDCNGPLKHSTAVGRDYMRIERKIVKGIRAHFNLPEFDQAVTEADHSMLALEYYWVMPQAISQRDLFHGKEPPPMPKLGIRYWRPEVAKRVFLETYDRAVRRIYQDAEKRERHTCGNTATASKIGS